MRAWEIRNHELAARDVEPPQPHRGAVLVLVSYVGICGSDLPKLLRPADFALPDPWRPGHEIVGIDLSGHPVAVDPLVPCGACTRCVAGHTHVCADLQRIGWDLPGGFAEYLLAPTDNVHIVPDGLDPLQAVLSDPAAVAIHGLRCNPTGVPGRLAVVGAGTVGLLTALYAHDQGWAVTVVHREGRPPRLPVTRAIPATIRAPSALTGVHTFDVVVDAASGGDTAPLDLALNLVRDGGTIIVQNAYHPDVRLQTPLRNIFRRSVRLIGSFSYCRRDHDDFAEALTFLQKHQTHAHHLVVEAGHLSNLPAVLTRRSVPSIRQALIVRE